MQEPTNTHGTVALPAAPSKKPIIAAIAALLVGGAIATGIWWLTDNDVDILPEPATHVIVSPSVETGAGVAAKNEAGVAAAVGTSQYRVNPSTGQAFPGLSQQAHDAGAGGKDEAATAAAVGSGTHQHGE
jgi:hypothetical protein